MYADNLKNSIYTAQGAIISGRVGIFSHADIIMGGIIITARFIPHKGINMKAELAGVFRIY